MKKIMIAAAALAATAGALTFTATPAHAESVYTWSKIDRCAVTEGGNQCFELGTYSTYSATQIWINGKVQCFEYSGNLHITWCGVGGGNGTATLNIGANFTFQHVSGSFYERMNIRTNGGGCSTWGSNTNVTGISRWFNDNGSPICENSA